MTRLLTCIAFSLSGCGATAVKLPDRVEVPVAVPCISLSEIPERPALRTPGEILALDKYKRTLIVWDERLAAIEHADTLRAILVECAR